MSIIQKSYSCKKCLETMKTANEVKNQFLANQQLLMAVDRFECERTMEIDDFIIEQYKTTPEKVVSQEDQPENPAKKLKCLESSSSDSSYEQSPELKKTSKVKVTPQVGTSDLEQCQICSRRMKDLRTHMFHYHRDDLATCDRCGSSFYKKATLEQHIINHHIRRRFPCLLCPKDKPKSYLTLGSLKLHTKLQHTPKKLP